jgi:hypothetical protein
MIVRSLFPKNVSIFGCFFSRESRSEHEDIPAAKKPRTKVPLPATTEQAATKSASTDAKMGVLPPTDADPMSAGPTNAYGTPSSVSTPVNEVELIGGSEECRK